ncbi:MAG TPA: PIG-L family deacetylase [Thermoanaerobaculia bacterium]|nr:PIG-L family deacetylase [Thermoanaerobaculia bacterium]
MIVAHPDDETIGAGVLLARSKNPWILHATDGAPRDPAFVARGFSGTLQEYATVRRKELEAAMALAGIGPERLRSLGIADQEAVFEIPRLVHEIAASIQDLAPKTVLTHAYEGGHPDHDALALATRLAVDRLPEPPELFEMALYHAGSIGEFLPGPPVTRQEISEEERDLKRRMIACFETQQETLAAFLPPRDEAFRPAPVYDFTKPPHAGPLQYELWGFGMTGAQWLRRCRSWKPATGGS